MTSVHNTKIGQDTRIYNEPYAPHYCRKSLKRKNLWSFLFLFFRVLAAGLSIALNQFGSVRALYMPDKLILHIRLGKRKTVMLSLSFLIILLICRQLMGFMRPQTNHRRLFANGYYSSNRSSSQVRNLLSLSGRFLCVSL